jgi:hypothetical protein
MTDDRMALNVLIEQVGLTAIWCAVAGKGRRALWIGERHRPVPCGQSQPARLNHRLGYRERAGMIDRAPRIDLAIPSCARAATFRAS